MRARLPLLFPLLFTLSCATGDDSGVLPIDVRSDAPLNNDDAPPYATLDASWFDSTPPSEEDDATNAGADVPVDSAPTLDARDATSEAFDAPLADCTPRINEVQTAGATAADEFVEIANRCDAPIDVGGFLLAYRSHTNVEPASAADGSLVYAFAESATLAAHAHFVVGGVDFAGPKDATESSGIGKGMLASTGGQLAIRDATGAIVDALFYGPLPDAGGAPAFLEGKPARAPASGSSVYRHPDGESTGDNSVDFDATITTPTPGAANP